ncbi:Vps5 C terminal like-domain-containing protein [Scheffersomyces coipomensis]|uniref:Vps5 C terminal like-domain-containing protein n=1 Tax=Scheffersomyces coipomensis TaxID=1788519 RepID=UPI00315D6AC9
MEQEDLTASHWDDVISPHNESSSFDNLNSHHSILGNTSTTTSNIPPSLTNQFDDLSINRNLTSSYYGDYDNDENDDDDDDDDDNNNNSTTNDYTIPQSGVNDHLFESTNNYRQAETEYEQLNELKKEERKEHSENLLSELTHGSEESNLLESSIISPTKGTTSESLFHDKGASPIKVTNNNKSTPQVVSPKKAINLKNSQLFKAPRPRKFSGQINAKFLNGGKDVVSPSTITDKNHTNLDPLGNNLNDSKSNNDKSSILSSTKADLLVKEADGPLYEIQSKKTEQQKIQELKAAKPKPPQSSSSTTTTGSSSNTALKSITSLTETDNKLVISVGDPMKVGDITTAHIVYSIKTKNTNPQSTNFPIKTDDNIIVSRRYKDFRWIYHQLQNNHPGRIIPPPPTKQTYIGRFNESFIENRRLSLEKMLNKISNISGICNDADFIMFLTSEDFNNESKERERLSGSGASTQNNEFLDNATIINDANSPGSAGSSISSIPPIISSTSNTGYLSSFFSIATKVNEPDEYFIEKKHYIDELEYNLKQLYLAIELIGNQRNLLVGVYEEISLTLDELSQLEISKLSTELLGSFSEVQLKIKDNLDRVNLQDQLTLGFSIEEYLRIIGSIKFVFETRSKIYQQYYTFNQEYIKKQQQLDKSNRKYGSTQQEKLSLLQFEVDKLKQKSTTYETNFKTISETIKQEIDNFEIEKIENFRNSVEIFIESSIESQKEAIELYETFYERQNLANI